MDVVDNSYIILITIVYIILIIVVIILFTIIAYNIWRKPVETNMIIVNDLVNIGGYVDKLDNSPSILVLNDNRRYTDKIYNGNDKILLVYLDNKRRTRYTYLDIEKCQILDKREQDILVDDDELMNIRLFVMKNKLYMMTNYDNRIYIISLRSMNTYKTRYYDGIGYIRLNDRNYVISSVMPLVIDEINGEDMRYKRNVIKRKWSNDRNEEYMIMSNGILINNFIDFICMKWGYNSTIVFIRLNTELNIIGISMIDMNEEIIPNGMIYNNITEEYYISYMTLDNRIGIYKVRYELVEYKMRYI